MLVTGNKSYDDPSSYFVRVLSVLKLIFQINSKFIITAIFCLITSVSYAADPTATKSQSSQSNQSFLPEWVYKELSSIQKEVSVLDATGATKESVQALKERLSKVEMQLEQSQLRVDDSLKLHGNRIEDLHASSESSLSSISSWTTWLSIFTGLLGFVVAGTSIFFSFSSKNEAIKQARKDASDWLKNNQDNLERQFEESKERLEAERAIEIAAMKEEINTLVFESKVDIASVQSKVKDIGKDVTENVLSRLKVDNYIITKEENVEVAGKVEKVLNKPDDQKSTNDWRLLAIDTYFANQFNEALSLIGKVFEQEKIKSELTKEKLVEMMYLKGIVLGKLNRPKEAIGIYTDLIEQFVENKEPFIQEKVIKALLNVGITLNYLNLLEEEIKIYSRIVELFGESKELVFQEQVAKALFNKGVTLGELKRSEEAVETYAQLVELFGESKELALQKQVASALSNKAELVLVNKDKSEAKKAIAEAIEFLTDDFSIDRVVMEFFNFIIEGCEFDTVLNFIDQIPAEEELGWQFEMLHPMIEDLDSSHKEQVKAIVSFFEEHKNKEQLKIELAGILSK